MEFGDQVRGVDVGDEPRRDTGVGIVPQGLIGHRRPEIGAADADVDHRLDPLTGRTGPLPCAQAVGEVAHRVQDGVHIAHHILTVDGQRRIAGQSQCRVQHGAVLGGVDVLAGQHRVATLLEARRPGQVHQ